MKVAIPDIGGIDILDEAGRSLGETALWAVGGALLLAPIAPLGLLGGALFGGRKRFKGFIVIHVKTTDNRVVKKLDTCIYIDFQKENSMTKPIICSHCGYQNVQHRSICHKCGEKLEIQPSETPEEQVHKMSNQIQGVIVKDIQMSFG